MITIDEYMKVLRARVDEFEASWRKNATKKKNPYPQELETSVEWDDQFTTWTESESTI